MRWAGLGLLLLLGCAHRASVAVGPPLPGRAPGTYQEKVTLTDGHSLTYVLVLPEPGPRPPPLVVALHYAGTVHPYFSQGIVEQLVRPALSALGAIVVAPDVLEDRDWNAEVNERAVVELTSRVIQSYGADPERVALMGYSMGGRGTWSIGTAHPDLFSALIPMAAPPTPSSAFPPQAPIYVIQSRDDELVPREELVRAIDGLQRRGYRIELHLVDGLEHADIAGFVEPLRAAGAWLQQGWD
ncbi:MAG: dienelactone hydrolase family protein [Myxococcota bacterium]